MRLRAEKGPAVGLDCGKAALQLGPCNLAGSTLLEMSVVGKDRIYVCGKP